MNADVIFEAVENSLRHCGDTVALQFTDRVIVCDIDQVPDCGWTDKQDFDFVGNEVLEEDIDDFDGDLYMQDCQPTKRFYVSQGKIVKEERVD